MYLWQLHATECGLRPQLRCLILSSLNLATSLTRNFYKHLSLSMLQSIINLFSFSDCRKTLHFFTPRILLGSSVQWVLLSTAHLSPSFFPLAPVHKTHPHLLPNASEYTPVPCKSISKNRALLLMEQLQVNAWCLLASMGCTAKYNMVGP